MEVLAILGEILPVVGTVALLGLWLYQQTQIERRAGELQKLAAARTVYQTYQSNNALFNAINVMSGKNQKTSDQIMVYQIYNYELGLAAIDEGLSTPEKTDIPPRTEAYDTSVDPQKKIDQLQERLGRLQVKLNNRENAVRQTAIKAKGMYVWLYVGISLIAISGAVCKVVGKLWAMPK